MYLHIVVTGDNEAEDIPDTHESHDCTLEWRKDGSSHMRGTTFYLLNSVIPEEELNIVSVYILDRTFN